MFTILRFLINPQTSLNSKVKIIQIRFHAQSAESTFTDNHKTYDFMSVTFKNIRKIAIKLFNFIDAIV